MIKCLREFCLVSFCVFAGLSSSGAEPSEVEKLGDGKLQVGRIIVDPAEASFSLPGRVIRQEIDAPMEFVAVTQGAVKDYEAVLELDTSAIDFNLACILIGLNVDNAKPPTYHFDPAEAEGDAVDVLVQFEWEGETVTVPGEALIQHSDGEVAHDWVYVGSVFSSDGRYMAQDFGTLVGFVHDPESIIQHRVGLGLDAYGEVVVNQEVAPQPGTAVTLIVRRLSADAPPVPGQPG